MYLNIYVYRHAVEQGADLVECDLGKGHDSGSSSMPGGGGAGPPPREKVSF